MYIHTIPNVSYTDTRLSFLICVCMYVCTKGRVCIRTYHKDLYIYIHCECAVCILIIYMYITYMYVYAWCMYVHIIRMYYLHRYISFISQYIYTYICMYVLKEVDIYVHITKISNYTYIRNVLYIHWLYISFLYTCICTHYRTYMDLIFLPLFHLPYHKRQIRRFWR